MTHRYVPDSSTVYTPQALAAAMVRAARGSVFAQWLDPCVGDGAFISEMAALGVARDSILAIDIANGSRESDILARTMRGIDFIDWARTRIATVDHIVMNPPYVALSRVSGEPLERALKVALSDGKLLTFKSNYWCAFVQRAVECLKDDGSMVAVLPAAWDFAKYATRVRESVERAFGEVVVVRCATPLFSNVKEGVVVVACFGKGRSLHATRRVEAADLAETISALNQVAERRIPSGSSVVRSLGGLRATHVRLGDIVDIRIGAVTGDAQYFLLTEIERIEWGLPRSAVRPVLSRSMHLTAAVIGDYEWAALRDSGSRVWLFRPTRAWMKHHAVRAYLRHGKKGGCNVDAFKVRSRKPWHRTPLPLRVDGFFSGMSKRLPFLVLRKMSGLTATNTLYVVRFRRDVIVAEKATLGLLMLTSGVRSELARHARVYADGLLKFEPTDLASVRVPIVVARPNAMRIFRDATVLLLQGREQEASALADAWLTSNTPVEQLPVTAKPMPRLMAAKA